jgi:hypothetical protein
MVEKKRSDYIVEFLQKGYSEQAIRKYYADRGTTEEQIELSFKIAKDRLNAHTQHTIPTNDFNINNQEQVQSVKQKYNKIVGIRLEPELYELIKENPTRLIKQAIKRSYGTTETKS